MKKKMLIPSRARARERREDNTNSNRENKLPTERDGGGRGGGQLEKQRSKMDNEAPSSHSSHEENLQQSKMDDEDNCSYNCYKGENVTCKYQVEQDKKTPRRQH